MTSLFKAGIDRRQVSLLPARVEDYVGPDNPVRAIEAYVGSLDLTGLGFGHADRGCGRGQPPYHPADMLKLYIYGYINQVRSSRRLEREAGRNLELMWLLRGLVPSYRTIAAFRADNAAALRKTCSSFVALLRSLELVGGEVVAIDGSFFDGNASKASIVTRKRLEEQLATAEREIATYQQQLDANDAADAQAEAKTDTRTKTQTPTGAESPEIAAAARLQTLLARQATAAAGLKALEASGETQLSTTDRDARLLSKNGSCVAGFNVQIAVDAKHKLIVASEVVNDGNDTGQLHAMAKAVQAALEDPEKTGEETGEDIEETAGTLTVVADSGYHNGEALRRCAADGIRTFVPDPKRGRRVQEGRFGLEAFSYDAEADEYACPHGRRLRPQPGLRCDGTGKRRRAYASLRSECRACPLRGQCLSAKGDRRVIQRWEHEAVMERHRAQMAGTDEAAELAAEMMCRRKALVEHPFGTLKCRAGYRHFLVRGFREVRGEWGLMALCYNLTRLLTILGPKGLIAAMLRHGQNPLLAVLWTLGHAQKRLRAAKDRCFGQPDRSASSFSPQPLTTLAVA